MKLRLLDIDAFRAEARQNRAPTADQLRAGGGGLVRPVVGEVKAIDESRRAIRYCFSDGTVDRAGDTIDPAGWELAAFERNPVALWAHMSWDPPIGRASNVAVEGGRLMGDIEFAGADLYPFAETVYQLARGGFINAVSVGFIPLEWAWVEDRDRPYGIDFKRQELIEISVCPVPCNPNALEAASAKGIDVAPLRKWAEGILQAPPAPAGKAGRVLSTKNETDLRSARDLIDGVLAQVEPVEPDEPAPDPEQEPEDDAAKAAAARRAREAAALKLAVEIAG